MPRRPPTLSCSVAIRTARVVPLGRSCWEDFGSQAEVMGGHDEVKLVQFKPAAIDCSVQRPFPAIVVHLQMLHGVARVYRRRRSRGGDIGARLYDGVVVVVVDFRRVGRQASLGPPDTTDLSGYDAAVGCRVRMDGT
uniref:HV711N16.9 n=1 Tax=Hordeum vulgare TaxID=4513 RepID=Q8LLB8_HORVU|nr:HV711N16.9 [Hordeum vulgare subsp. vulgare]